MALESEAIFLKRAVRAGVLEAEKGTAALQVYSQLKQMGAAFSFGHFLVERGLLSNIALSALETSPNDELQTISTIGDFQLLELIGEGESGSVFRARQTSLDRLVALKILNAGIASNAENLERFQHEARATARLNHPNVVHGIAVGSDQGLHYFAMELVEGGSARGLLESADGALDETTVLKIAQQAAQGLKAAHLEGLLHRDLKPDNILLTLDGQAKLADLGISQNFTPKLEGVQSSADFWASPPYVAPEVIRGVSGNDPRSDIYSLGATLFELLAGRPPFVADSPQEVLRMHLTAPVPDILLFRADVTAQTAKLAERMLAKDPAERVPNAQTVIEAVVRILALKQTAAGTKKPGAVLPKFAAFRPPRPGAKRRQLGKPRPVLKYSSSKSKPKPKR